MTIKTDYSRFDVHDVLTAPRAASSSWRASREPARSPSSSACSPARRRRSGPMRGCATSCAAGACRSHPRADLPGGCRAPRRPLLDRPACPHRARRRARARRGLTRAELPLGRREGGGAAHLPRGAPRHRRTTLRPPRRGGARVRLERRAAARGGGPRRAQRVPEPDLECGRAAAGPNRSLDPPAGGLRHRPSRTRDGPGHPP